jgi:ABC-type bacteriocin/lantibiotic exporter with double-glycine peptidase domain
MESATNLGRLVSRHSTSPAYLQRAAVVCVVSLVFFLVMLVVFYVRQQIGYFLLSTGFLVVYVFTLIGWLMQKRNVVAVHEKGLKYKKFHAVWDEIESIKVNAEGLSLTKDRREKTLIPPSVNGYDTIVRAVKQGVESGK